MHTIQCMDIVPTHSSWSPCSPRHDGAVAAAVVHMYPLNSPRAGLFSYSTDSTAPSLHSLHSSCRQGCWCPCWCSAHPGYVPCWCYAMLILSVLYCVHAHGCFLPLFTADANNVYVCILFVVSIYYIIINIIIILPYLFKYLNIILIFLLYCYIIILLYMLAWSTHLHTP